MGHVSRIGWSESGFKCGRWWDSQTCALTPPALPVGQEDTLFLPMLLEWGGKARPTPEKGAWGSSSRHSLNPLLT